MKYLNPTSTASVAFVTDTSSASTEPADPAAIAAYLGTQAAHTPSTQVVLGAPVAYPRPQTASWLGAVQRRLNGSIGVRDGEALRDGTALSMEVVSRANSFLEATSDLLPAEPYIYGSGNGDLVAEFNVPNGQMTLIISTDFAIAYAAVGGHGVQRTMTLKAGTTDTWRSALSAVTDTLQVRQHGAVDTGR